MTFAAHRKIVVLAVACIVLSSGGLGAQVAGPVPQQLEEVGVVEQLDTKIPLELSFRDEVGELHQLGSFFDGERPVILTLNYYRCPMLCGLMLNGLVEGLGAMDWTPGSEFEVVTVSIDPLETPVLATEKKQNYMKVLDRPGIENGWHFLTGKEEDIKSLAEAVGFGYAWDEEGQQYAHPAVIFVITPDGRVARYLYGIEFPAQTLKLSLLEAADGTIGTTIDRVLLYCFHYDPADRRYSPVAMNIMRVGAGLTASVLGLALGLMWGVEAWRRKKSTRSV